MEFTDGPCTFEESVTTKFHHTGDSCKVSHGALFTSCRAATLAAQQRGTPSTQSNTSAWELLQQLQRGYCGLMTRLRGKEQTHPGQAPSLHFTAMRMWLLCPATKGRGGLCTNYVPDYYSLSTKYIDFVGPSCQWFVSFYASLDLPL